MVSIILMVIGSWLAVGLTIYAFKVFVYCRGPKHYMDLNVMILQTSKSPLCQQIIDQRAKVGDGAFVFGAFIIAMIVGPIIILDVIRFAMLVNKCLKINEKTGG